MTLAIALTGAGGSVLGYLLLARGPRWTTMLCVTVALSLGLGALARMVRIVDATGHAGYAGYAALPVALLGPVVTFVGIGWWLTENPRRDWWRAALVVGGGVAAAVLGYLSIDLLGLAYVKFPRFG